MSHLGKLNMLYKFQLIIEICVIISLFLILGFPEQLNAESIQRVQDVINQPDKVGDMNNKFSNAISIIILMTPILLVVISFIWLHNKLVSSEENVFSAWAQVESNYQRRADLVPNLIETVKTYAASEQAIIEQVSKNQQHALESLKGSAAKLNDESAFAEMANAQKSLGDSMLHLLGVVGNYPNLKASDNFLALQDQLEGTENRINTARMVFNQAVQEYNSDIRKMPSSLIASLGGFKRKAYFKSDDGADKAPKVNFNAPDQHNGK